jgi:hypothetical protein
MELRAFCGTPVVSRDRRARAGRIENLDAHRDQKRTWILQGRLHQIADQGAHLPQRVLLRKRLDRIETDFQLLFFVAQLAEVEAIWRGILERVRVDDLVANFPPVVVAQLCRFTLKEPVRIGEQRTS